MKRSRVQQINLGFGITLLMLLLNAVISYRNILVLIRNERSVSESHQVIAEIEKALSTLKDAETGQRGYLLTGQPRYLEPYNAAISQINQRVQTLKQLAKDSAEQQQIQTLEQAVSNKLIELDQTIQLRRTQGLNAALRVVQSDRGKQMMDSIRHQMVAIERQENQQLQRRAAESQQSLNSTLFTFTLVTGASLVLLGLVAAGVRWNDTHGQQAELALQKLNASLEDRAELALQKLNASLEDRIEERTSQLTEINQELEAFTYSVSHDLRAPLRIMQGFAQALEEDYGNQLDDLAHTYIESISESSVEMDDLINDLLDYSRLSRTQIQLQPTDLSSVIHTAIHQLGAEIQKRRAIVNHPSDLPSVIAYRPILIQVVVNLISNAIKFVDLEIQPIVTISTHIERNSVRLSVVDNGIGIALQYQERIFRVFERLHGIETFPGTGIGLAIVRKGIERMGGQVGLESQFGHGSHFWIALPLALDKADSHHDSTSHSVN